MRQFFLVLRNVGFLKYYTVKQIPNFLLAIPIVLLSLSGIWVYISNNWRVVLTLGLRESKSLYSHFSFLSRSTPHVELTYLSEWIFRKWQWEGVSQCGRVCVCSSLGLLTTFCMFDDAYSSHNTFSLLTSGFSLLVPCSPPPSRTATTFCTRHHYSLFISF